MQGQRVSTYSPVIAPARLERGRARGRYRDTPHGLERRCRGCDEYWPADTEFFAPRHAGDSDGLQSYCRACVRDKQIAAKDKQK